MRSCKGSMDVEIKLMHEDAVIPRYESDGAAGFDFSILEDVDVYPGRTYILKTGLAFAIPHGFELQIRPRSGTSFKTSLRIANSPGTIDSDYRGEVGIIVENIGEYSIKLENGDRIAQGVIAPVVQGAFKVVEDLSETVRGSGGFGSTGK